MADIMTQTFNKYIGQMNNAHKTQNIKTNDMLNNVSNSSRLNKTINNITDQINYRMNRKTSDIRNEEEAINELNMKMFRYTNDFNSAEAEKARDFSEYMSSTAHQREVNDLRAAGLNPVLSAGGQGASTPNSSNASAGNWSGATESALNSMTTLAKAEMDAKTAISTAKINAQTNKDIAGAQIRAGLQQNYAQILSNLVSSKGGYKSSMTSAKYGLAGALANAGATEYAAATAADASYNMAASQLAGVGIQADAQKYVARKNYNASKYSANRTRYGAYGSIIKNADTYWNNIISNFKGYKNYGSHINSNGRKSGGARMKEK